MRHWYRDLIGLRKKLRKDGLIDQTNLTVEGQSDDGLFILRYKDAKKPASGELTVATRLANPELEKTAAPVSFSATGNVVLDSRGETNRDVDQADIEISANQTLILHSLAQ